MVNRRKQNQSLTKEEIERRKAQSQRDKANSLKLRTTKKTGKPAKQPPRNQPYIWTAGASTMPSLPSTLVGKEAESTIVKHLNLESGAVLPRPIPTYVQPHLFRVKKNLRSFFPELGDEPLPNRIAIIARPDMDRFISVGAVEGDVQSKVDWDTTHTTEVDFIWTSQEGVKLCFDENLHLASGKKVIASQTPVATYRFFKSDKLADGMKWYPGAIVAFGGAVQLRANIYNPDQSELYLTPGIAVLRGDPSKPTVTLTNFAPAACAPRANTIIPFSAVDPAEPIPSNEWNTLMENAIGVAIVFTVTNPEVVGRIPSGFSIQVFEVGDPHLFHLGGIRWLERSIFEVLDDNGTLRNQFLKADSFSVTGVTAWLENVTATIYKGGSIAAAQLAGGSEANLPTTISQLESYIRRQTRRVMDSNKLANGLFWTYVPEKTQDIFFEPTTAEFQAIRNVSRKPYMATVFTMPTSADASPEFVIDLRLIVEYITQEIDAPKILAPANVNEWLEKYYGELSKHNCVTENPDHMNHLKRVAKSVVTSPLFRQAAKDLVLYGVKSLPMLATSFL